MSAAGDRARARIRRNRRELELLALSGAFGPIVEEPHDAERTAALCGVCVDALRTASAAAIAGDDEHDDDGEICNPPAGASWVDNRTTPFKTVRM